MSDKFLMSLEYLLELRKSDENILDEYDIPVSDYALLNAIEILQEVFNYLKKQGKDFDYCHSDIEAKGGVYLIWNSTLGTKKV